MGVFRKNKPVDDSNTSIYSVNMEGKINTNLVYPVDSSKGQIERNSPFGDLSCSRVDALFSLLGRGERGPPWIILRDQRWRLMDRPSRWSKGPWWHRGNLSMVTR
ncbi:unnamed protein product [Nesidiocoris tenuis]|uniref:Uncharacterized protein n=1 Tax=Nesidiocoris tenuis TaxID=355587 RepID=A0A6H5HQZ0_9HEMI|nr:unnamed protein product [Nesidiocoris tenuis]